MYSTCLITQFLQISKKTTEVCQRIQKESKLRCAECIDYLHTWKVKNGYIQGEMYTMSPQIVKDKGFGHLKTSLFSIKTSKHVGLGAHGR